MISYSHTYAYVGQNSFPWEWRADFTKMPPRRGANAQVDDCRQQKIKAPISFLLHVRDLKRRRIVVRRGAYAFLQGRLVAVSVAVDEL